MAKAKVPAKTPVKAPAKKPVEPVAPPKVEAAPVPEPVEVVPEPVVEKPSLVKCVVENDFRDGGLAAHFAKFGYPVHWPAGQVRHIPAWLVKLVLDSGGKVIEEV